MESLLFWTFAVITLAGGVGVVLARNPVNGAMALVGSFFALAGLFLLLDAQLIAALQILVYAGAIMVLFLFVIMLLNLGPRDLGPPRFGVGKAVGLLAPPRRPVGSCSRPSSISAARQPNPCPRASAPSRAWAGCSTPSTRSPSRWCRCCC